MKSYSADLRAKIIKRRSKGASAAEVARDFQIHKCTVERYWRRYQEQGVAYCKQRGGYRRSVLDEHRKKVVALLEAQPDMTLHELQHKLSKDCGVSLAVSGLLL
jgi:transposase